MPEVKLVNVTKKYGRIIANDKVNLTIQDREYVSVIGPSGCGKTTLIKNIAGIISPDEGEIFINSKSVSNTSIEDREIGYVFQNIALFPHMTVWENMTYGPQVRGLSREKTQSLALEMREMIRITARSDAYPHELSGGTKQKTAVARALISEAEILLLDEPLGALDVKVRAELRYELRRLVKDLKLTALHVTHDQEEAMSISDRVVVMKKGRIIEAGIPIDLYVKPKTLFTANFVGEANFLEGVITEISNGSSLVDIREGLQLTIHNRREMIGEHVVTVFRPEFAVLNSNREDNSLPGEVVNLLYSGNVVRVRVRLPNENIVVVKKAVASNEQLYSIGETVRVQIAPENILLYPYPEGGLQRELALE